MQAGQLSNIKVVVLVTVALLGLSMCSRSTGADGATVGVIQAVDLAANQIRVVTPDGIEQPFQLSADTEVIRVSDKREGRNEPGTPPSVIPESGSLEESAKATEPPESRQPAESEARDDAENQTALEPTEGTIAALQGKEGSDVVVYFKADGPVNKALTVEYLGPNALQSLSGPLVKVDEDAGEVLVHTWVGGEEAIDVNEDPAYVTPDGLADIAELDGQEGQQITIYFSSDQGQKIAHLIRLDPGPEQASR